MPNGSLSLAEYPAAMVRLKCDKCGRAGQYRKTTLIQKYSPDMPLPELHAPWESRHPVAGYPEPIVDHGLARELALAAYAEIKKETQ